MSTKSDPSPSEGETRRKRSPRRDPKGKPNRESPNSNHDGRTSLYNTETKRPKVVLWPEFTDIDLEKWDASSKGKETGKQKAPVSLNFEDPDGKIEMPPSMTVDTWKRPHEMSVNKNLVVVDLNCLNTFDLITPNEHLHDSEVMRHIITQIITLWENSLLSVPRQEVINEQGNLSVTYTHSWRPWEHIYALCKSGKGAHMPLYNQHGKYIVRLYFMGSWRKIAIDDSLPFDSNGKLLLPVTTYQHELWPLLLTKGLIKIAALDYQYRRKSNEFNGFNVLHHLTGWHPQIESIVDKNARDVWNLLLSTLPEWDYSKIEGKNATQSTVILMDNTNKEEKEKETLSKQTPAKKVESKVGKVKEEVKPPKNMKEEKKKDKAEKPQSTSKNAKEEKKKDKGEKPSSTKQIPLTQSSTQEVREDKTPNDDETNSEISLKDNEIIIFATYRAPYDLSKRMQANASENLRQVGLSYLHPFPVLLTQTRSVPFQLPPPEEVIPRWKLIRPRKKKTIPSSEPKVIEDVAPVRSLEVASAFLNYKIKPMSIPSATTCSKSYLKRGGGRYKPSTLQPLEETNETIDSESCVFKFVQKSSMLGMMIHKVNMMTPNFDPTDEKDSPTEMLDDQNFKQLKTKSLSKKFDLDGELKTNNYSDDSQEKIQSSPEQFLIRKTSMFESEDKNAQRKDEEADANVIPEVARLKKTWIDFDQFCQCFQDLYIYHKATMYEHTAHISDLKMPMSLNPWDDNSKQYLFIDSLQDIKIVISYSSLSHWPEVQPANQYKGADQKGKESEPNPSPKFSGDRQQAYLGSPQNHEHGAVPGHLAVEPHSWKTLVMGNPILTIDTTAIRAAVLSLPAGRHVLQFSMTSPLGYSVHLFSTKPFVFGDEDTVFALCTKESRHFRDIASKMIISLGKCIQCFDQREKFEIEWKKFEALHCPYINDKHIPKAHHFEVFHNALYESFSKVIDLEQEVIFALRVLIFDTTSRNVRPSDSSHNKQYSDKSETKDEQKRKAKMKVGELLLTEGDMSIADHLAAVKLQKCWRGRFVRKIRNARIQGTSENLHVSDILKKYWSHIENNMEEIGLHLFRTLFKNDPRLIPHYEFHKDEWNKITYADYQGSYPEQPPKTWFVIFRGVFMVHEEMMIVPKLYIPLTTSFIRVINNDTGKELRRIFKHVSPAVYYKNKKGYTIMAEAHSRDQQVLASKWRLRLIGSLNFLPTPIKNEVCSSFYVHEIKDYYIPSETSSFFMNYTVQARDDHLATIQMSTSNPDVVFQLSVLDNESVIYQVEGKGHAVLPAVMFYKDLADDENVTISSSKDSFKQFISPCAEQITLTSSTMQMDEENDREPHKYQIQASVHGESWPLIPADWQFVISLRDNLKKELYVDFEESATSPSQRLEKIAIQQPKSKTSKDKLSKEIKECKEVSRTSQQLESNRPHWILQLFSDSQYHEQIDIRRDTSRAEEIRLIKRAREEAEPGRAAKAIQSQMKYLNTHLVKVEVDKVEIDEILNDQTPMNTPPSVLVKQKVPLMDITPYLRDSNSPTVYLDDELFKQRQQVKLEQVREYEKKRKWAREWMVKELKQLRLSKLQQLDTCRQMQLEMDIIRESYNRKRENYRRRAIEAYTAIAQQKINLEELTVEPEGGDQKQDKKKKKESKKSK